MSSSQYHPQKALANPEAFYQNAFENYPRRWIVPIVGNLAVRLTRPNIFFYQAENEADYFNQLGEDNSLALTFTHRGLKKFHDPGSAAAAVFGSKYLRTRISGINVWAAAPYMTNPKTSPIINRLGTVPVIRSNDWNKYGLSPSAQQQADVRNALVQRSVTHLENPANTLAVFPAGTKGGEGVRDGIGFVLENLENVAVIPVAMVSDSEKTSNKPDNLRLAFGEPVLTAAGITSSEYVKAIDCSLTAASSSIGG